MQYYHVFILMIPLCSHWIWVHFDCSHSRLTWCSFNEVKDYVLFWNKLSIHNDLYDPFCTIMLIALMRSAYVLWSKCWFPSYFYDYDPVLSDEAFVLIFSFPMRSHHPLCSVQCFKAHILFDPTADSLPIMQDYDPFLLLLKITIIIWPNYWSVPDFQDFVDAARCSKVFDIPSSKYSAYLVWNWFMKENNSVSDVWSLT